MQNDFQSLSRDELKKLYEDLKRRYRHVQTIIVQKQKRNETCEEDIALSKELRQQLFDLKFRLSIPCKFS